jgi:hypothetical protein
MRMRMGKKRLAVWRPPRAARPDDRERYLGGVAGWDGIGMAV